MFKEHVADRIKTRNIRGLFRVPEINDTNHLVVDAKEEDQEDEGGNMNLPDNDLAAVLHDRAVRSYPIRKPEARQQRETKGVEELPLTDAEGIEHIRGFENPTYKYETQPRSIKEYLKLAKMNEHK